MIKLDLMGHEIWEVDTAEAKALWVSHPADRWRLWDHSEVDAHMSSGPAEILAAIATKTARPGKLANIPVSPPTSPLSSAAWCVREGLICSEVNVCLGKCAA